MQTNYKIISNNDFKAIQKQKYVKRDVEKKLSDGSLMICYTASSTGEYWLVINETVYYFDNHPDVAQFWKETTCAPAGTVKYNYKIDYDVLDGPVDLNYTLTSYEFFSNTKLTRYEPARVLSENFLNDGRVSILYTKLNNYRRGFYPEGYYLVMGRLVISGYRMEKLKILEHAINYGVATFWRPELSGTMDYIPKYSLSNFDDRRHKKFVDRELFCKSITMPVGSTAGIYRRTNKTVRYYMHWLDKIYSFAALADCEMIIKKIQENKVERLPSIDESASRILKESLGMIGARLGRYMSADMRFSSSRSEVLSVGKTGSLTGLKSLS